MAEEVVMLFDEFGVEFSPGFGGAEGAGELPGAMDADFVSDGVRVFHAIGGAVRVWGGTIGGIECEDVVAIVDVAFEYEAGEAGFEAVGGDACRGEVAVGGEVEVWGVEFALDSEWNGFAVDADAELVVDVGKR